MRKKKYQSDISREQFEQIRPLLENARKRTKPRTVELYEVFCAVLYLLKSELPVEDAARRVPEVAHGAFLLRQMERARPGRCQRTGAGIKKIRLARPVPDRGETP